MLEWLIISFLGLGNENFLSAQYHFHEKYSDLPQIEILQIQKIPHKKKNSKLSPVFLPDPNLVILAVDVKSGRTLYKKKEETRHHIASLSKLMTFWIIFKNHHLDEIVTVDAVATKTYGSQIGLYANEKIRVKTLLEALLIPSANDAAKALAIFHAGSEDAFVKEMNLEGKKLGLQSARFYNATGLDLFEVCPETEPDCDTKDHGNQMSASDLAFLSRLLLKNKFFRETVLKKHFYGNSIDEKFFHEKKSTNQLLGHKNPSRGLKTGYTELAGQCFINLMQDEEGNEFLTIVLGSSDRFGETVKLSDWIFDAFIWR